jgi:hypothetical protein
MSAIKELVKEAEEMQLTYEQSFQHHQFILLLKALDVVADNLLMISSNLPN